MFDDLRLFGCGNTAGKSFAFLSRVAKQTRRKNYKKMCAPFKTSKCKKFSLSPNYREEQIEMCPSNTTAHPHISSRRVRGCGSVQNPHCVNILPEMMSFRCCVPRVLLEEKLTSTSTLTHSQTQTVSIQHFSKHSFADGCK